MLQSSRNYIFGMMFLKRLSDAFSEEQENVTKHYLDKGRSKTDAEKLAEEEGEFTDAFFVPSRARWSNLKDLKHEIVGANWLQQFPPKPVTEPIRLHVPAKRYLCAIDTQYWPGHL